MKKSKVMSLLLAGALLVGGTFLGTKALFSDTATSENKLTLNTGKVDISVKEGSWLRNVKDLNGNNIIDVNDIYQAGTGAYEESKDGTFNNVKPGDTFTRYVNVFSGNSTYDVNISVNPDPLDKTENPIREHIEIEDYTLRNMGKIPAGTNSGGYFTIKIKDTPEAWSALNGAGPIQLDALYEITATQAE